MEREVDISPRQILAWLRRDATRGGMRRLDWRAIREFTVEPASGPGIDAEDGLDAGSTVGLIEVEPHNSNIRWRLRLRIEDPLGSHLPDDGSVPDEPEPMDLDAFEAAFLADGMGGQVAEIGLEADSSEAVRHFRHLVADAYTPPPGRERP